MIFFLSKYTFINRETKLIAATPTYPKLVLLYHNIYNFYMICDNLKIGFLWALNFHNVSKKFIVSEKEKMNFALLVSRTFDYISTSTHLTYLPESRLNYKI